MPKPVKSRENITIDRRKRLREIESMLGLFYTQRQIVVAVAEKFKVSERQVYEDCNVIIAEWEEESRKGREQWRDQTREFLRSIARRAMADKQYGAAVAAVTRVMELDGLREIKVNGKVDHHHHQVEEMTSAQQRAEINQLLNIGKGGDEESKRN